MKKEIITFIITTIIVYAAIYLLHSFITWSIANPFNWIIMLPNYTNSDRFCWVVFLFAYAITYPIIRFKIFKNS